MGRRNIVRLFLPRAIDSTVKILARAWFVRERCLDRNVEQSVSRCHDWWFAQRKGNSRYASTHIRVHAYYIESRDSWTVAKKANRTRLWLISFSMRNRIARFRNFSKNIRSNRNINRVGINLTNHGSTC